MPEPPAEFARVICAFAAGQVRFVLIGGSFRVASIDDLIAMKRAAGRPKDQAHVFELLALKRLIEEEGAS